MEPIELLLSDPTNRELVALLFVSSAHQNEKQLWLTLIPVMTDAEKEDLKLNLENQIEEDIQYDEKVLRKFISQAATV